VTTSIWPTRVVVDPRSGTYPHAVVNDILMSVFGALGLAMVVISVYLWRPWW